VLEKALHVVQLDSVDLIVLTEAIPLIEWVQIEAFIKQHHSLGKRPVAWVILPDVRVVVHPLRGDANDADALEAILVSALDNIRHPKSSSQPG
jgi:hypothetical protein